MDYVGIVLKIYPEGADFNPACFGFSEAEAREKLLWRDEKPMPTQEQIDQAQADMVKAEAEKSLYKQMVIEIYDQMEAVFGTRTDVSVSAFVSTWEAMLKRPANFVDVELGLIDESAVIAYATDKLNTADAYGVYRLKRIAKFEADKQAL